MGKLSDLTSIFAIFCLFPPAPWPVPRLILFPRSYNTCAAFVGLSLRTALSVCPVRAVGTTVAAFPDPPLDEHETIPNPDHLPKHTPPIRYYSSHPILQLAVVSLPVRAEIGCAQRVSTGTLLVMQLIQNMGAHGP